MIPKDLETKEIFAHNRTAWDKSVEAANQWTVPVTPEQIEQARQQNFDIVVTPIKPVPKEWLGHIENKNILALAGAGGQQAPLLAAAGAKVTVVDLSPKQLDQDRSVARRENLEITIINSTADDLSMLEANLFDLIINPCSSCFFPKLQPVWQECRRVLKPGGDLITGFNNPISYCFDFEKANQGHYEMRYPLPFSDIKSFSSKEKERFIREETPLEFSHTLSDQIGGLITLGFVVDGFYEDDWGGKDPIDRFFPQFMALKAHLPS